MSTFTEISIFLLILFNVIVFIFAFTLNFDEDDRLPYIFCQRYLWEILDERNINFAGKLILCTLCTPLTILYTVMMLVFIIGGCIIISIWKLFCLLFQKKS